MRELCEADFHEPGFYGSGRAWANAWDVFRPAPFRGSRGRRAAVDYMVCFGWGGFFVFFFFSLRTPTPCGKYEATSCLNYLSTSTGVRTGCHYLISLCVRVCVTFVLFTDCESCTRPISTNPGSMEAGEHGRTRGTCFDACRLELIAVAGRLWISWCVLGGAGFFCIFFSSNAHGLRQV